MIKEENLLQLMELQDDIIHRRMNENLRKVFEDEFIMSNIYLKYLEYRKKCCHEEGEPDWTERLQLNQFPVKKTADFDISRHDVTNAMYLHRHTYIELDYVYRGSCRYYIKNEDYEFELKENEICIVNQNIVHGIETNGNKAIIIKCMIPFKCIDAECWNEIGQESMVKRLLEHALTEDLTKASYLVLNVRDHEKLNLVMYQLFEEYVYQHMGWRQAIKNYIAGLFLELMRLAETDVRVFKEIDESNLNITKILDCIRKNYQYITLKDLAKDFHFHENYLSRMIKQNTNKSFRELLIQIRLNEAEKLLIHTNLPVSQIAARVGYHKPNFFYKLFKEHYGITPIEYRTRKERVTNVRVINNEKSDCSRNERADKKEEL